METNEIMTTNEEVIVEVTDEIANASSGKALKVVAGVGLTVLGGTLIYKFVVKPLVAKAKAKKNAKVKVVEEDFYETDDFETVEEDVVDDID